MLCYYVIHTSYELYKFQMRILYQYCSDKIHVGLLSKRVKCIMLIEDRVHNLKSTYIQIQLFTTKLIIRLLLAISTELICNGINCFNHVPECGGFGLGLLIITVVQYMFVVFILDPSQVLILIQLTLVLYYCLMLNLIVILKLKEILIYYLWEEYL